MVVDKSILFLICSISLFVTARIHLKYCVYPYHAEAVNEIESILKRSAEYGFSKFFREYSQNKYEIHFQSSHVTDIQNPMAYLPIFLKNLRLYFNCYYFGIVLSLIVFFMELFIERKLAKRIWSGEHRLVNIKRTLLRRFLAPSERRKDLRRYNNV